MGKIKKGMFYTIGFLLLSGIIIGFAILLTTNNISETITIVSATDKANEMVLSIQDGFNKIFDKKSGISVSSIGTSITFEEDLPNNNATYFKNYLDSYKSFIESKNISILLSTGELKTYLPLKIKPHNIEYRHLNYGDSKINISAVSNNFGGYSLTVYVDPIHLEPHCTTSGGNQSIYISVDVYRSGQPNSWCNLNKRFIKKVNITGNLPNPQIAVLELNGNDLTITSFQQISVKTTIENLNNLGKKSIVFPDGLIYLNYSDFNIVKNTTVNLL